MRRKIGSIRFLPAKNLWEIRYSVGKDAEGKRVVQYATVPGPDTAAQRKEAERVLSKFILLYGEADPLADELPTLTEWIETYIASRTDLSENTITRAEDRLKQIRLKLGHLRLDKLTPDHLEAFYRYLMQPKPGGPGWGKGTIVKARQLIQAAYRRAMRRWPRLITTNPAQLSELPKLPESEAGKAMPLEHQQKLLEVAYSHRLYAMVYLTLVLGLRRGEALGLKWSDVKLTPGAEFGGWLHIQRAVTETRTNRMRIGPTKTSGSVRKIPLSLEAAEVLEEHRLKMETEGRDITRGWLFPSLNNTPIEPRNFNRLYDSLQIQAGLYELVEKTKGGKLVVVKEPLYRLHDLRVTNITDMIRETRNPKLVATYHGHRSVHTSLKVYQKIADADLIEAVKDPQRNRPTKKSSGGT